MANNVLPLRLGEVVRSYYLGQRERISTTSALATVGIDRIYDGLTLIFFILVVWPFLPLDEILKNDAGQLIWERVIGCSLVLLVFVGAILVFVAVAIRPIIATKFVGLLVLIFPLRFKEPIERSAGLFVGGLSSLDSVKKLAVIFILSLPIWLMESLMYYFVTLSFDFDIPFSLAMVVTATSNLVGALPAAPGNVGTFEWAIKVTLVSLGYNAEVSVAYAAALHVVLWLPVVAAGLYCLWVEQRSLVILFRGNPVEESGSISSENGGTNFTGKRQN
jgi:uncharacterized protein (TIRG00374 family)